MMKSSSPFSPQSSSSNPFSDQDPLLRQKVARKKLYTASVICVIFVLIEVTGGILAKSLAILSDAAHLMTDLASFLVAIVATHLASLPATQQHTFGLQRVESLAALFSISSLVVVTIGLVLEAFRRFYYLSLSSQSLLPKEEEGEAKRLKQSVNGAIMTGTAVLGVVVNLVLARVLGGGHLHMPGAGGGHGHSHGGDFMCAHELGAGSDDTIEQEMVCLVASSDDDDDEEFAMSSSSSPQRRLFQIEPPKKKQQSTQNVNVQAAYLHVLADLAQSIAVLVTGCIIWIKPGWHILDPIMTLGFSVLVLWSSMGVMKSSIAVLLDATPPGISWQEVYNELSKIPTLNNIHDLHLWSISAGQPALSVHCVSDDPAALRKVLHAVSRFGVEHCTVQIQRNKGVCLSCQGKEQRELPTGFKLFGKSS